MRDFHSPPPQFAPQFGRPWDSELACAAIAARYPQLRAWNLKFQSEDVPRDVPHDWRPDFAGEKVLCALVVPLTATGGKPDFTQTIELLSSLQESPGAILTDFNSATRVFVFSAQTYDSIDLLNPEATRLLLEQMSAETTSTSFSIPTLFNAASCAELDCWPWTPLVPDAFAADHGYALIPRLPSLVADTGSDAARVRQDFWSTIVRLLKENLWQPISHWEQASNGAFRSPAAVGQEPLRAATLHYGDIAPAHHASEQPGCTRGPDGSLAARLCASVAALGGRPRARAEFEANLDAPVMLTAVLHLLGQGINAVTLLNCQPSAANCQQFSNAVARYCYALSQGRPAARVGVLLATRSTWAHHHPRGHRFTRWVDEDLHGAARLLDELHFDYLLLPEADLISARCESQELFCGAAALPLEMMVVPSTTTISWAALRKLEEFVAGGGKVAFLGLLPRWSENGRDEELEKRVSKLTMVIAEDIYDAYAGQGTTTEAEDATIGYPITRENEAGGRLSAYQPRLNEDRDDAQLRVQKILKESLAADLETQSPHLRYTRRVLDHGDVFLLLNTDGEAQLVNVRLRPSRMGRPYGMNVWSGTIEPLPVWMQYSDEEGEGLSLELHLAAHEARLIWVQTEPESEAFMPHAERANFVVEAFDGRVARGYATEDGEPKVAVREHGKLIWHTAPPVIVPAPLLLNSDNAASDSLSWSLRIPIDWAGCHVFLEVDRASEVEAVINNQSCGTRLVAPYRFDVTHALSFGEMNELRLHTGSTQAAGNMEQLPAARLVAYPSVTIEL